MFSWLGGGGDRSRVCFIFSGGRGIYGENAFILGAPVITQGSRGGARFWFYSTCWGVVEDRGIWFDSFMPTVC